MCGLHWFHTESPTIVSISQHKVHFKALSEPFSCISADVDQRKLDLDLRSFSFREPEDTPGTNWAIRKSWNIPFGYQRHHTSHCSSSSQWVLLLYRSTRRPRSGRDPSLQNVILCACGARLCLCNRPSYLQQFTENSVETSSRWKVTIFQLLRTSRKTRCKSRVRTRRAAPRGKQRFCWRKLNVSACLAADAR